MVGCLFPGPGELDEWMRRQEAEERRERVIWAAGFLDGEGCVDIRVGHPRGVRGYAMRVSVSQLDRRPLDVLTEMWGGSLRLEKNHKPRAIYRWTIQAHQARLALIEMLPFLVVKREQAEIAIEFQTRRLRKTTSRTKRLADEPENQRDWEAIRLARRAVVAQ